MRNMKSIIFFSFIGFLFCQPPGEIIDHTMIDIANYWNSSTNQIFIDEADNVFIGYNFSNTSAGSNPQVKVKNISTDQFYLINDPTQDFGTSAHLKLSPFQMRLIVTQIHPKPTSQFYNYFLL